MTGRLSLEEAARTREIREWAAAHRIPCAARGPIPPNVREAWQQAADGAGRWIETASGPPHYIPPDHPRIVRYRNSGPPDIA